MKKYYSSYYLSLQKEINEEQFLSQGFAFRVFFVEQANCKIAERLNKNQEVLTVYYYINKLTDKIQDYHRKNYSNLSLGICEKINTGVQIRYYNSNYDLTSMVIETFHEDGRAKLIQEFDANFELVEYHQCIYDNNNIQRYEKIFFTNSWVIHEEDL